MQDTSSRYSSAVYYCIEHVCLDENLKFTIFFFYHHSSCYSLVGCQHLTVEMWAQSQDTPHGICDGRNNTGAYFSQST
jgi:hypothetical protein